MSPAPWSIDYESRARRDLRRLDNPIRVRAVQAIEQLAEDPDAASLRKLANRSEWRLRVGDWRVLLELDNRTRAIHVQRILPRGRAYDR